MKFRKAYHEIVKALSCGGFKVVILLGIRRMGKTEILKQLANQHGGYYHDFKQSQLSYTEAEELFERDEPLLLLDEVGYLDCFDLFCSSLFERAAKANKRVVITSSYYGAMKQLGSEYLGAGRSWKVELFPLSFEEYLHFSRDDFEYGDDYEPSAQDVDDFYRLKNIPFGMDFVIDRQYFLDTFTDIDTARANRYQDERDVVLSKSQYVSILDVIANKMAENITENLGIEDISHIVAYLFHSGFLFVDTIRNESGKQNADTAIHKLLLLKTFDQFKAFFAEYNFCVISPLLYTRLLIDLEVIAGRVHDSPHLAGELFELAVKSELVHRKGYDIYHESCKYKSAVAEVDLCAKGLLLEATITHKQSKEHSVDKVLEDCQLIRVLTDSPGMWEYKGTFYRIGYPKALLMVSNGTIHNLEAHKVLDTAGSK